MPSKSEVACKALIVCTVLSVILLTVAAFIIVWQGGSRHLGLLHLVAASVFLCSFRYLRKISQRIKKAEEDAHLEELWEMQQAIEKSELRYKSLLEGGGDAIFVLNSENGILEEVNQKGTDLLGYSKEEMERLSAKELVSVAERRKFAELVRRVKKRGSAASEGLPFQRKDGSIFLGSVKAQLIDLRDEQVVQVIIRDVTYRSRTEREIKQRNRELSILNRLIALANESLQLPEVLDVVLRETLDVFAAEGGAIHLMDGEGNGTTLAATYAISEALRENVVLTAQREDEQCHIVSSRRWHCVSDLSQARCCMARAASADGWQSFAAAPLLAKNRLVGVIHLMTRSERHFSSDEMKFLTTIGTQIGIVIEHARLFVELNRKTDELQRSHRLLEKSSHQLAISQNRLKKNLLQVERANVELERLDRMKNHFLGMVSHEFKTPLTSIISGTQFLLAADDSRIPAESRQVLDMVLGGGMRLHEILNDLLKVARLEAKSLTVNKAPLQLREVFEVVLERVEPLVRERNQLVAVGEMTLLPFFKGDREYLEEVFANLLENAVKFTPDGGQIRIETSLVDKGAILRKKGLLDRFHASFTTQLKEVPYLQVEISDSGIGVDHEEQLKIFDKFYEIGDIRHHSSGKHKFLGKGAGLGLAIVKGMVEAHDGMVWMESAGISAPENTGSSFFVLLPLEEDGRQPTLAFLDGLDHQQSKPDSDNSENH
ncbi:MAG: PAS domain S-box protein [Geobacter sp.]|nr:PAS domain S-box protein [Geobacter sp.]